MIIRISPTTGPVAYEIADTPSRLVVEGGQTLIAMSLTNVRGGSHASLMISLEEIDRLNAERRKLRK